MRILGFGAHPDDIEISMFGLMSAFKKNGNEVFLAVATDGLAGTYKGKSDCTNLKEIRSKETIKALKPITNPILLSLPDGSLNYNNFAYEKIYKTIIDIEPDIVVTHSENDYHSDHRALSKYIVDAVNFRAPVLFSDNLMCSNFEPDYYIDITYFFKKKIKAMEAHISQNPEKFVELIKIMNSFRAAQYNYSKGSYAEAYRLYKTFPYNDISKMLPNLMTAKPFYKGIKNALI